MKRLLLPVLSLSLALGLAACGGKPAGGFQMPPRPVTAVPVAQEDVPVYIDEIGTCLSPETVSIVSQVTGKIVASPFTEGADVKKGDLLFAIDPRPYQAALDQAAAAVAQDEAKLKLAKDQFDRSVQLSKGNFISPQDLDTLRTNAATAEAQYKADAAAVENARLNLEYCSIVSPIDGRLGKRLVDVGNVVAANGTSALVVVQRTDLLYVDFTVAETDLPRVRSYFAKGPLKVLVSLPDQPDAAREGALSFLDNTVTPAAGTVQLRATLPNQDRAFWPGQFVNVRLVLETLRGALLVPTQSIQISQKGPFVFVVKADSTADLRPVEPGQRHGDRTVVGKGVTAGEQVVVTGQLALAPGGKVAVMPAPDAKPAASAPSVETKP